MKKLLWLPFVFSSNLAFAIHSEYDLNWAEHPYIVESSCTGTIISGKYIAIAGHCGTWDFPRTVYFSDNSIETPIKRHGDLYDRDNDVIDFSIWELKEQKRINKVIFFEDLNNSEKSPKLDDVFNIMGFGQYNSIPSLKSGNFKAIYFNNSDIKVVGIEAESVPGDSGAPVLNENGNIIGGLYGGISTSSTLENLFYEDTKNYILTTINRWHSVTTVEITGVTTIEVQSLHQSPVDMAERWNAGILTTGDAKITGGSCVTDGAVDAFEICELTIESQGEEGTIHLENDNTIIINPKVEETPDPEPEPTPDGKGGGSSMGIFGVIILTLISIIKQKK